MDWKIGAPAGKFILRCTERSYDTDPEDELDIGGDKSEEDGEGEDDKSEETVEETRSLLTPTPILESSSPMTLNRKKSHHNCPNNASSTNTKQKKKSPPLLSLTKRFKSNTIENTIVRLR
ncbi:CNT_collapsed_G0015940.mRNA.1.CDS.1 [Saccharomyces cerevisiae]|nr:CNT_collapsed_G0015940.mRNA.1.CDS.1 [Saccharomyces cerevisiae]